MNKKHSKKFFYPFSPHFSQECPKDQHLFTGCSCPRRTSTWIQWSKPSRTEQWQLYIQAQAFRTPDMTRELPLVTCQNTKWENSIKCWKTRNMNLHTKEENQRDEKHSSLLSFLGGGGTHSLCFYCTVRNGGCVCRPRVKERTLGWGERSYNQVTRIGLYSTLRPAKVFSLFLPLKFFINYFFINCATI